MSEYSLSNRSNRSNRNKKQETCKDAMEIWEDTESENETELSDDTESEPETELSDDAESEYETDGTELSEDAESEYETDGMEICESEHETDGMEIYEDTEIDENESYIMERLINMWWNGNTNVGKILKYVYESEGVNENELKEFIRECGSKKVNETFIHLNRNGTQYKHVFKRDLNGITKIKKEAKEYIKSNIL